jgi:hypothetical protein
LPCAIGHRCSSTAERPRRPRAGPGPAQAAQSLPGTGLPPAAGYHAHPPHARTRACAAPRSSG